MRDSMNAGALKFCSEAKAVVHIHRRTRPPASTEAKLSRTSSTETLGGGHCMGAWAAIERVQAQAGQSGGGTETVPACRLPEQSGHVASLGSNAKSRPLSGLQTHWATVSTFSSHPHHLSLFSFCFPYAASFALLQWTSLVLTSLPSTLPSLMKSTHFFPGQPPSSTLGPHGSCVRGSPLSPRGALKAGPHNLPPAMVARSAMSMSPRLSQRLRPGCVFKLRG